MNIEEIKFVSGLIAYMIIIIVMVVWHLIERWKNK